MRRRKRERPLETIGSVLVRDKLLKEAVKETRNPVSNRDWETAVGTRIAAKTRPIRLDRGLLMVVASSAAWSNELSLLSQPIIQRLRSLGLQVNELRFRVGAVEPDVGANRRAAKLVPNPTPLDAPLVDSLARVEDPELREALKAAAARMLGFRNSR